MEVDDQGTTKTMSVQTPAIINGKIKKIEVNSEPYHYISMKLKEEDDSMDVD